MARHRSAEKRARQDRRREVRNTRIESRVKSAVKGFREALATGDKTKAEAALGAATRELRKAASKGVVHKRNASRKVSRLVLAYNRVG